MVRPVGRRRLFWGVGGSGDGAVPIAGRGLVRRVWDLKGVQCFETPRLADATRRRHVLGALLAGPVLMLLGIQN
ncbi:hypothetical protein B1218_35455, partial [Pseudomonas ogarae]